MSSDSGSGGDSDGHGSGGRGFKLKHKKDKDKKDKKDKDKKEKKDKDKKGKDKKDKDTKDKKDKDKKDKHGEHSGSHSGFGGGSHFAMGGGAASEFLSPSGHGDYRSHSDAGADPNAPPPYPPPHDQSQGFVSPPVDFKSPSQFGSGPPPPQQSMMSSQAPPSGYRVPLRTDSAFPPGDQCGPPVAYDADDASPIFIGSALFESSVQPCKIGPHLQPTPVALAYGGREVNHNGRYDLLPFVPDQMEWIPTQYGQIPPGRRPVEGGYEENGSKLYHAIVNVDGVRVPGKTGEHLGAANISFGGQELPYQQYEILCWRY